MSTLLFRLAAPMQAWGTEPRFDKWLRTGMEPSKSGVIGMVASAMGIDRTDDEAIQNLVKRLRFGVCVDREGTVITDYHATRVVPYPECSYRDLFSDNIVIRGKKIPDTAISKYDYKKYYLSDAAFTIGLECKDDSLLHTILEALRHPKRMLYLGRKSCPLMEELDGVIVKKTMLPALKEHAEAQAGGRYHTYRIIYDAGKGERGTLVNDEPVSFNANKKVWAPRMAAETMVEVFPQSEQHDPFAFI